AAHLARARRRAIARRIACARRAVAARPMTAAAMAAVCAAISLLAGAVAWPAGMMRAAAVAPTVMSAAFTSSFAFAFVPRARVVIDVIATRRILGPAGPETTQHERGNENEDGGFHAPLFFKRRTNRERCDPRDFGPNRPWICERNAALEGREVDE